MANNIVKFKSHEQSRTPSTLLSVGFFFPCSSSKYCVFIMLFRALHRFIAFLDNVWSIRSVLIQALTCCVTEREEQRRRGGERRAPDESTKLRVRCDFFCTNATSGIMRRRRLMCESRVCPHPKGFADSKRGKHVRKGDIFLICSHSLIYHIGHGVGFEADTFYIFKDLG